MMIGLLCTIFQGFWKLLKMEKISMIRLNEDKNLMENFGINAMKKAEEFKLDKIMKKMERFILMK